MTRPAADILSSRDPFRLELSGELDVRAVPRIIDAAASVLADEADVVIDLSGVEFIDAAGMTGVITVRNMLERAGRRCTVDGASPRTARTFTLGHADSLLRPGRPDARTLDHLAAAIVSAVRAAGPVRRDVDETQQGMTA